MSYHINNRELSKVTEHRDLGVIFTENLSWHSHYEAIVAKAYKSLGLLKRIFKHKGELQWKNDLGLYFSLVLVMKIGMCDFVIFRLV